MRKLRSKNSLIVFLIFLISVSCEQAQKSNREDETKETQGAQSEILTADDLDSLTIKVTFPEYQKINSEGSVLQETTMISSSEEELAGEFSVDDYVVSKDHLELLGVEEILNSKTWEWNRSWTSRIVDARTEQQVDTWLTRQANFTIVLFKARDVNGIIRVYLTSDGNLVSNQRWESFFSSAGNRPGFTKVSYTATLKNGSGGTLRRWKFFDKRLPCNVRLHDLYYQSTVSPDLFDLTDSVSIKMNTSRVQRCR